MRKINKHINNVGRIVVDALMLLLLLGILALPAGSASLLRVAEMPNVNVNVLSVQDTRPVEKEDTVPETTKSMSTEDIDYAMDGMDLGQSGQ